MIDSDTYKAEPKFTDDFSKAGKSNGLRSDVFHSGTTQCPNALLLVPLDDCSADTAGAVPAPEHVVYLDLFALGLCRLPDVQRTPGGGAEARRHSLLPRECLPDGCPACMDALLGKPPPDHPRRLVGEHRDE